MTLHKLDKWINWLSDQDWAWWPFLSLRPAQHQTMSFRCVLSVTLLFGSLSIFGLLYLYFVFTPQLSYAWIALGLLGPYLLFFCVFQLLFARAWNKRTERIIRDK